MTAKPDSVFATYLSICLVYRCAHGNEESIKTKEPGVLPGVPAWLCACSVADSVVQERSDLEKGL
jgi:hypothetical protein